MHETQLQTRQTQKTMVYKTTFKKPINTRGKLANRLLITIKSVKSVTKYFHKRDITRCRTPSLLCHILSHPV